MVWGGGGREGGVGKFLILIQTVVKSNTMINKDYFYLDSDKKDVRFNYINCPYTTLSLLANPTLMKPSC
jgi:hypothetical protein